VNLYNAFLKNITKALGVQVAREEDVYKVAF